MKVYELTESTEQQMAAVANQAVSKAKAGDIGGAADDMERMHNSIARLDIGSGLYDFMQKTLRDLKALVKSNPNHPEAPKFVQAIKDIEAGLPAMKQAAADSRKMAVDAGAGRQDVGEGRLKSKSYKKSKKAAKASGRRRKKSLRDDVNETTASSIAAVSGNVGTMQSRNMYNDDGTMKNGVDFDNLLGSKKKIKKRKTA